MFEAPEMPDWVKGRRAQMSEHPMFEAPEMPDWVKEHRARMPHGPGMGWNRMGHPMPHHFTPAGPYGAFPDYSVPGYGAPGWGGPHWGGPGRYWGGGPFDGMGDLFGDIGFNFSFHGSGRGYGDGYGYHGYGPYGWPVIMPPAPVSDEPAEVEEPTVEEPTPEPAVTDGDADGVLDTMDMCPESAPGATVDVLGCEQDAAIVLRGVNFKTDSAELTDDSVAILDRVANTLVANPEIAVEVSGHTDSDGDDAYNKDLSQRRAETVMAYLTDNGVAADKMTAMGYGEERPMATNETTEGKALNRRVELNRQ